MNPNVPAHGERPGPIAYMAENGIGANLLMFAIIAAGLMSLGGLDREAWPIIPLNHIEVSMSYPGATPEEVEEAIVARIEDQVSGLEDVKAVKSTAALGMASVRIQLRSGADMNLMLDDVKAAVDRITSFPSGAERPQIREMTNRQSAMRLIVYGDIPARSLKELTYRIDDGLTALDKVSDVKISGARDYEISIEVPLQQLRSLGLTLDDVADAVRASSLELSAGSIDTRESQVRVRTLGQRYQQHDFEDVIVVSRNDGTTLRLGDIARVQDGLAKSDLIIRHQNKPALFVEVYRAEGERIMDVAKAVKDHVANEVIPSLPEGTGITIWNDASYIYAERAQLLVKNGLLGLLLVFIALTLFLDLRLAVWVAVGLALSAIGALAVMLVFDLSLSSVSLFTFVLAIGIVVDDAIVVAEHIHHERKQGATGVVAAIRGARRIKTPLTFAVLTSVAAFTPLLFMPGGIGEVMRPVPIVLIGMLVISLVESLLILPNHLSHLPAPGWQPTNVVARLFARTQGSVDRSLRRFVDGPLDQAVRFATDQPVVTIAVTLGMLIISVSLLPAGIVKTSFSEEVEGDFVTASLVMTDGATAQRTYEVARELELAGLQAIQRFSLEQDEGAPPLVSGVTTTVGMGRYIESGGINPDPTLNPPANIATVEFKLSSVQERQVSTSEVVQAWRDEVGFLPYARSISFTASLLELANPVEIMLSHPDPARLVQAANSVVNGLRSLDGVFDVRSDHTPGVKEVQLELLPEAYTLDLTLEDLAQQTRAAFFGTEALRVQRGREEVRVYVRLPAEERIAITDVERYLVRTQSGAKVPLNQVAELGTGSSPTTIQRRDGQRIATIIADVNQAVISSAEANNALQAVILAELMDTYPDLTYIVGGEQQEQYESFDALNRGLILSMLVIYGLLTLSLRSYTKPFIIMAVIPFGLTGAILGHLILGIPFSSTSAFGFIGLCGVVVNDSLVMLDFIDQRLQEGAPSRTAIIDGAKGRFRPILLTSVTTFLGFTPIILERAIHAKFLVPFAASLGFGILFATAILMMLVPAITVIHLRTSAFYRRHR